MAKVISGMTMSLDGFIFEDTGLKPVQLERLKVMELPGGRTHLRFRFVK